MGGLFRRQEFNFPVQTAAAVPPRPAEAPLVGVDAPQLGGGLQSREQSVSDTGSIPQSPIFGSQNRTVTTGSPALLALADFLTAFGGGPQAGLAQQQLRQRQLESVIGRERQAGQRSFGLAQQQFGQQQAQRQQQIQQQRDERTQRRLERLATLAERTEDRIAKQAGVDPELRKFQFRVKVSELLNLDAETTKQYIATGGFPSNKTTTQVELAIKAAGGDKDAAKALKLLKQKETKPEKPPTETVTTSEEIIDPDTGAVKRVSRTSRVPINGNSLGGKVPSGAIDLQQLGKVRVVHPDGRKGFIPQSQLQEALRQGFKLAK